MIKLSSQSKTITKYLSSSFLSIPVSLITGFMIYRNIEPYYLGVWGTLLVFEVYTNYSKIGIVNGMNRQLPFMLGKGDVENGHRLVSTTYAFTIIHSILIFVALAFCLCFLEIPSDYFLPVFIVMLKIISGSFSSFISGTFRSNDNFNTLSNIQFVNLGIKITTSPLVLYGFQGYLLWETILALSNAMLLYIYRPIKVKPKFEFQSFKHLIIIGFPIFLTSNLISTIDTLPRLFIITFESEKALGLYSPVLFILSTVAILPNQLTSYFYPKFTYDVANTKSTSNTRSTLRKIVLLSTFALLAIAGLIFLSTDTLIKLFPKYIESKIYIKLSLLAVPFVLFKLSHTMSAVFKNLKTMSSFVIFYFIIQISSLYILNFFISDIITVAVISQVITYLLMTLMAYFFVENTINNYSTLNG